jgi:hypothetical protein
MMIPHAKTTQTYKIQEMLLMGRFGTSTTRFCNPIPHESDELVRVWKHGVRFQRRGRTCTSAAAAAAALSQIQQSTVKELSGFLVLALWTFLLAFQPARRSGMKSVLLAF